MNTAQEIKLGYFGTDLHTHGHYIWQVGEERLHSSGLNFKDFPFNPEQLVSKKESRPKGAVDFFVIGGYSILRIEGSPIDKRWGTTSVFWINREVTKEELISILLSNKTVKEIIVAMPFKVQLDSNQPS